MENPNLIKFREEVAKAAILVSSAIDAYINFKEPPLSDNITLKLRSGKYDQVIRGELIDAIFRIKEKIETSLNK